MHKRRKHAKRVSCFLRSQLLDTSAGPGRTCQCVTCGWEFETPAGVATNIRADTLSASARRSCIWLCTLDLPKLPPKLVGVTGTLVAFRAQVSQRHSNVVCRASKLWTDLEWSTQHGKTRFSCCTKMFPVQSYIVHRRVVRSCCTLATA